MPNSLWIRNPFGRRVTFLALGVLVLAAHCREEPADSVAPSTTQPAGPRTAGPGPGSSGADDSEWSALAAANTQAGLPSLPDMRRLAPDVAPVLRAAIERAVERKDAESIGHLGHLYRAMASDINDLGRAAECYERAMALEPARFEWPYYLARAFFLRGSSERAKMEFQRAAELNPDYAMTYGWMGEIDLAGKRFEKAKPHFEKFAELRPDDAYGHIALGSIHAQLGDIDAALESLRRAVEVAPDDRQARLLLADVYARLGKEDEARQEREAGAKLPIQRKYLERDPLEQALWMTLGPLPVVRDQIFAMANSGNRSDAAALCEAFLAKKPDDYDMLILLGRIQLDQGAIQQAVAALEKAASIQPERGDAHTLMAEAHLQAQRTDQAVAAAQRAIELDPAIATAHFLLARALLVAGRQAEAEAALSKALELPVDDPDYWVSLAELCLADRRLAEARRCYEKVLALDPADPPAGPHALAAYAALGRIFMSQGDLENAAKHFREALRIQPTSDRALCGLGYVLEQQGKVNDAFDRYQQAVQDNPSSAFALGVLGDALSRRGMLDDAIKHLRRAATLEPNAPVFHAQLGNALALKRDDQGALAELRRALELAPGDPNIRHTLGAVLDRSGNKDAATREWRQALESHPQHINARLSLMSRLYRDKEYSAARETLLEGLKHAPDAAPLANALAWIMATCPDPALRNGAEAVNWAEKACQWNRQRSPGFVDTLAAAYAEAGRFDDAVKTQNEAISLLPKENEADLQSFRERLALYQSGKPYRQE